VQGSDGIPEADAANQISLTPRPSNTGASMGNMLIFNAFIAYA